MDRTRTIPRVESGLAGCMLWTLHDPPQVMVKHGTWGLSDSCDLTSPGAWLSWHDGLTWPGTSREPE